MTNIANLPTLAHYGELLGALKDRIRNAPDISVLNKGGNAAQAVVINESSYR